jgi:hypothetical protein
MPAATDGAADVAVRGSRPPSVGERVRVRVDPDGVVPLAG